MSNIFALCRSCGAFARGRHAPACPEDPATKARLCGEFRGSVASGDFQACDLPDGHLGAHRTGRAVWRADHV